MVSKLNNAEENMGSDFEMIDILAEGVKSALICEDNQVNLSNITSMLKDSGYEVIAVNSVQEAEEILQSNDYHLIVLNEGFQGETLKTNSVLRYLNSVPMALRRDIFVVLIGKDFKTLDNMTAFANSVNVVINADDLKDLRSVLNTSMAHCDTFYRVFKDYLKEAGKA
jgi:CheY-like chemotaxis protein